MQKADLFAELEKIFQSIEPTIENDLGERSVEEDDDIRLLIRKEVLDEIRININQKKAAGYDLFMDAVPKHLPRKGIVKVTNLTIFQLW